MNNLIVIGSGPCGVSAAIYAARAGVETLVISNGVSALKKADRIENYYGFSGVVSGAELYEASIINAKRLGVKFVNTEVIDLQYDGDFQVTADNLYRSAALLLATGSSRITPKIDGISTFEGSGVSYCAVCDAFFYRKKIVGVIGSGNYAISEAQTLAAVASLVYIFTNGEQIEVPNNAKIQIITDKIIKIDGSDRVDGIITDKGKINLNGVFIAVGVADSTALAKKIGAVSENGYISVNENRRTNVPGLYAGGDCIKGLKQIVKAAADGAVAAIDIISYLKKRENN